MQDLNDIFKDFSQNRLSTYRNFLENEYPDESFGIEQVYNLYTWNEKIASYFWLLLSRIEITLRNRINDVLVEKFGKSWLKVKNTEVKDPKVKNTKYEGIFFQGMHKKQINKLEIKLKHSNLSNERMVAELNMGFWVSFSKITFSFPKEVLRKEQIGWKYFIPKIMTGYQYPNEKADKERYWSKKENIDKLISELNSAKEIRNRIAHHEPIFNYTPAHLQGSKTDEKNNFLITLRNTYQYLLYLLHILSPKQAQDYQRSDSHHYTLYLLSIPTFEKYLNLESRDEMIFLEDFIKYLESHIDNEVDTEADNRPILHVSHNSSYFGCFMPQRQPS